MAGILNPKAIVLARRRSWLVLDCPDGALVRLAYYRPHRDGETEVEPDRLRQIRPPGVGCRRGEPYARVAVAAGGIVQALDELCRREANHELRDELLTYVRSTGWGGGLP